MNPEVKFGAMLKQVPIRLAELVVKLLSFKGLVLGITVFLAKTTDLLDGWMVLIVITMVLFGREAFKIIELLRR